MLTTVKRWLLAILAMLAALRVAPGGSGAGFAAFDLRSARQPANGRSGRRSGLPFVEQRSGIGPEAQSQQQRAYTLRLHNVVFARQTGGIAPPEMDAPKLPEGEFG